MHDDRRTTEERIQRVLRERIRPAVHPESVPVHLQAWHAPGEPVPVETALAADYSDFRVGDCWGPPWSTTWFRVRAEVPHEWTGRAVEALLDLGFHQNRPGFQCEGLVHRPDGRPVKGLNPRNTWIPVDGSTGGDHRVEFFVEAAANPVILGEPPFAATSLGDPGTAGGEPLYRVRRAELAVLDEQVWELVGDVEVLDQLMRELDVGNPRRWEILRCLERALDALDLQDVGSTAEAARAELAGALSQPAQASAHQLSAVGHAHIDSAWLWPLRETVRKVARTASNVTNLMDRYPDFVFAMSQAQQFAWLREHHPAVYSRVREKVVAGQFLPVGGMWVESDTNMPGGEALARQLVHGKRFFLDAFDVETREVWLPDSFGYSAALPQLVALSASSWFFTQKISWNQSNRFPHHTFSWEGLDGTRIFTHFPPADTYNAELSGAELARASSRYAEKGAARRSLIPFGWGDGGGGPTREMLARAARQADLEGSPQVSIEPPSAFYRKAAAEYTDPPVWVGELYLEFHRGTYTSQAGTKRGNRRSEHLLREAELWAATAAVRCGSPYPYEQFDRLWKTVLLNQFHDILPGSSIAWVHREAEASYELLAEELEVVITRAQEALAGRGDRSIAFNAAPHDRDGVPAGGAGEPTPPAAAARVTEHGGGFVLDNDVLRVVVDARGAVTSLFDRESGREAVPAERAANVLQVHPDLPNAWDAWDVDAFYRNSATDVTEVEALAVDSDAPERSAVRVERRFSRSTVTQVLGLRAGERRLDIETEVDWHETEKFLKLAFPVDVHTDRCASEIQFGHVHRPTHENTSWDAAKFEICAHRWVHVAEAGFGVAVLNDRTYGHDVSRWAKPSGGTCTTVRASLLRAPRFPDPDTDHGRHRFRHALLPGADVGEAVREGYRLNLPARTVRGGQAVRPLVEVDEPAVVVESVKMADDRSGDLVVRLYESRGGRTATTVTAGFPVLRASSTDLLERDWDSPVEHELAQQQLHLALRPFEIRTLRLRRS
ncbi:glycoside hydrolase family 38 C-terminal domain-containing protein [Salinifilum aidingensis]